MISTTSIILCFTFLNFLFQVRCAAELPAEDSYGIVVTEWAIRNTVNNLFSTLKLKDMQHKLKLKQYLTIHKFFVSITLQDHDNLKEIARLTKVENIDNGTQVFITQLNEVLNEDNKSDEATDAVYITILIEEFLNRLDNLKEIYGLKNNTKFFDINKAVIKNFNNNEKEFGNTTYLKKILGKGNDSNDNVLSSKEFWQPSGRRIFQGKTANIKRFPFMASVKFFKKFQCGGSIIKSTLVITSASCLQLAWNNRFFRENPAFLSVQVGSTYYEFGGETIPVSEINFHPNYNPKNLRHNLALMRITRALSFGKTITQVKKIEIDRSPFPLPSNTKDIIIIGWGAKGFSNSIGNLRKNQLSYSVLEFYPLEECQEIYSKEFVTNRNFCAGFFSKGGGACNRDAGGPGISNGILIGVVSFGSPACGAPDAPTVFTKLGFYTDWIEQIMETKIVAHGRKTTLKPPINLTTIRLTRTVIPQTSTYKITPIDESYEPDSDYLEPEDLKMKDKTHDFKGFLATIFESEESSDYLDEKEIKKLQPKQALRKKSKKKTKKKKSKPKGKKKPKHKSTTESHVTVIKKQKGRVTKLIADYYDSSSSEVSTSVEMVTLPYKPRNADNIKASSSQEKKMEAAIEVLIDNLDLTEILKSGEIAPGKIAHEDQQQTITRDGYRNIELIESYLSDKTKPKEEEQKSVVGNKNQSENEEDENGSNSKRGENSEYEKDESSDDEGNEDSTNENENYAQSDSTQSNNNVESVSNGSNDNELSEEMVHGVYRNNEMNDYEVDYESDINKPLEALSIPAESIKKESPSINPESLLEMLVDTDDVYELLVGHPF